MEAMLAYLLKVSVSAILFYLFIRILMERETQHEYIRGLWVGAIVFSLVLPFIYVPVPDLFPEKAEAAESVNIVMSGGEPEMLRPEETYTAVDWIGILGYIYIAGAAIVSILYVVSFIRLYIRIKRTPRTHEYDSILRRCAEESGCSRNVRLRCSRCLHACFSSFPQAVRHRQTKLMKFRRKPKLLSWPSLLPM